MRFRRLSLEAFGPFTREVLDLSGGAPGGLHVIYGPNEAGKSTSLRAVEGLLFGIPERTEDAHLHAAKNLAVGAVLERGFGATKELLTVTRRKRRKDTLVDAEGNPLPDDTLASWLLGLDQRSFFVRFGLDQTRLEQGAEALLAGSEEGLFAAGTGGPDVASLSSALRAEEDALYGPRAKRPLNRAFGALADATRAARQAARPPEKWREQKRAHEEALEKVAALREERSRLKGEQGRLLRLTAVRSDVSRWVGTTEELERLGPQPELPADAETRRGDAQRAHRDAQRELERLGQEMAELQRRLGALPPQSSLLEVEDERWESLEKKIGWEHKAREDRPKLEGKLVARLEELRRHLARLGKRADEGLLEQVEALRVEAAVERRAQRLSARHAQLELAVLEAQRQLDDLRREQATLSSAVAGMDAPPDVDALELAVGRARHVVAGLAREESLTRDMEQLEARIARLRRQLELRSELPAEGAALPTEGEVQTAQREAEALEAHLARWTEARRAAEVRWEQAQAALAAQDLAGEVPSEARLAELRRERDACLADGPQPSSGDEGARAFAEELARRIAAADHAADRLRLEAHRVSEREKYLGEREAARAERARCDREIEQSRDRLGELQELWTKRFAAWGMARVALARLSSAQDALAQLLELEGQWALRRRELETLAVARKEARDELRRALGGAGLHAGAPSGQAASGAVPSGGASAPEELQVLADWAGQRLAEVRQQREQVRAAARRADELAARIAQQELRAAEAEQRLGEWRAEWQGVLTELGLPAQMPPDEAQAVLAELTELERLLEDARDKQRRLAGIDRDSRHLGEQVAALVERHAPELRGLDALEAAAELVARLRKARDTERDRRRIEAELAEKRRARADVERARDAAWSVLEELMATAHVTDPAELGPVEQRARRARELVAQRIALEDTLRAKAGSGSVEELIAEARAVSSLELSAQCDEVEGQLEEVEEALRSAEYDASAKEAGLELYRSEDAAAAEQRAASAAAEARQLTREFLVLRTARVLLQREITRYAERHQGPILARANEHFPRLTLGRYSGLRVGLGERTLRCVRDGKEVEVGELSRGTRAQLYLALRLASLEHHFEHRPPVPLVFDDLFVDFDDDRACAAFEILGELAERVQILYFTHLGRDLHAARDAVPPPLLFEHRIGVLQPVAQPA